MTQCKRPLVPDPDESLSFPIPGSKILVVTLGCWSRWVVRRFDTISEASEFLDHLGCPCCSGLLAHSRAAFLRADALMQHLPDQEAPMMGDRPDGLFETEPRQETPKHHLETVTLALDGGVRRLIQKAPQEPVTFWRLVAGRNASTLLFAGAYSDPRSPVLLGRKGRRGSTPSAMIGWAESTPRPGTSASRCTAS